MDDEKTEINPYQPPQVGRAPWFHWRRVPYGLYRAYRGYLDQMQRDGHTVVGHMLCWAGILFFGLVLLVIFARIAFTIFHTLFPI